MESGKSRYRTKNLGRDSICCREKSSLDTESLQPNTSQGREQENYDEDSEDDDGIRNTFVNLFQPIKAC